VIPPYFVGVVDSHCRPGDDYTMILDAKLELWDSLGVHWEAPAGLETDGASVRQLLCIPVVGFLTRIVLRGDQFTGPFRAAAVIHDGAYALASESSFVDALFSRARAAADRAIFDGARARLVVIEGEAVDRTPAAWWRAAVVHALLRLFGWKAWMDDSSKAQRSLARLSARG
jgi:hypothetical protein